MPRLRYREPVNIHLEDSGRRIAPFGDPPGEIPILNRPLAEWQAEAIAAGGFTQVDTPTPPCLVVPDTLFFTGEALRTFVEEAAGRDAVFVLATSRFGTIVSAVQPHVVAVEAGWRYEKLRLIVNGDAPVDVVVSPDEQTLDLEIPNHYLGTDTLELGIPRHPVMPLHHWVHILWANQMAGGIELRSTPKWKFVARGLWAALRAFSLNKWKVLGKMNTIGRGCDIHPTAVVEGSTLGDGVTVGAFARVLFSRLDDGAVVMPGGQVDLAVVGKGATVSENSVLRFSVLYPNAVASQYLMQQCVVGRGAVTTSGAYSIDLNFDQDVRVPLDGELVSTGQRFIGSAFGHGCRIGTGFWMASGRSVPNGAFLIRDPDLVLARVPPELPPGPIAVVGRGLQPLLAPAPAPAEAPPEPPGPEPRRSDAPPGPATAG